MTILLFCWSYTALPKPTVWAFKGQTVNLVGWMIKSFVLFRVDNWRMIITAIWLHHCCLLVYHDSVFYAAIIHEFSSCFLYKLNKRVEHYRELMILFCLNIEKNLVILHNKHFLTRQPCS